MHGKPNKPPQINSVSSPFVFSPCLSPPSFQLHPSLLWHPFPIFNVPLVQLTFNITQALLSLHHLQLLLKWRNKFPEVTFSSSILISPSPGLILSSGGTARGQGRSRELTRVQHQALNSSLAVAGLSLFVLEDKQLSQCN